MWKITAKALSLLTLLSSVALAQNPPVTIKDEGVTQGIPVFNIDCVGAGINCTHDGTTGTLNVSGGGGGGATQLSELSDVNTSTPTNRNVLVADGVDFESRALTEADISDLGHFTPTDIDTDYGNETVTSDWIFQGAGSTGANGAFDVIIGDGDHGGLEIGTVGAYCSSFSAANLDISGAFLFRQQGNLHPTNDPGIEFAWMEGANSIRMAIPESGADNATAMIRSVTVAGPYSSTIGNDIVSCDQWTTYDSNIDCDTSGTGADLFVQDDLETEGSLFLHEGIFADADDANQHHISFTSATADRVFTFPDDQIALGDLIVGTGAGTFGYTAKSAINLSDFNNDLASGLTLPIDNNTPLTWRNAGDTADVSVLILDASDEVTLKTGGTDGSIYFADDSGNLWDMYERAGSQAGLRAQEGTGVIHLSTSDTADNGSLQLSGGGDVATSRGAVIYLLGNENNNGDIWIYGGNTGSSRIKMGQNGAWRFENGQRFFHDGSQPQIVGVDDTQNVEIGGGSNVTSGQGAYLKLGGNSSTLGYAGDTILGTGTSGVIEFETAGTDKWFLENDGDWIPQTDSTYDIGEVGAEVNAIYVDTLTLTNSLDISDSTNLAAGRSLTLSGDSVEADAELYTRTAAAIGISSPTATSDVEGFGYAEVSYTITGIYCKTDTGTADIDIQLDDGSPADVNGTDITCTSAGVTDTSFAGDTGYAAGEQMDLLITSVASSPTKLIVRVWGTVDD